MISFVYVLACPAHLNWCTTSPFQSVQTMTELTNTDVFLHDYYMLQPDLMLCISFLWKWGTGWHFFSLFYLFYFIFYQTRVFPDGIWKCYMDSGHKCYGKDNGCSQTAFYSQRMKMTLDIFNQAGWSFDDMLEHRIQVDILKCTPLFCLHIFKTISQDKWCLKHLFLVPAASQANVPWLKAALSDVLGRNRCWSPTLDWNNETVLLSSICVRAPIFLQHTHIKHS